MPLSGFVNIYPSKLSSHAACIGLARVDRESRSGSPGYTSFYSGDILAARSKKSIAPNKNYNSDCTN